MNGSETSEATAREILAAVIGKGTTGHYLATREDTGWVFRNELSTSNVIFISDVSRPRSPVAAVHTTAGVDAEDWDGLWARAVDVLTQAIKLRRHGAQGDEPGDFPDFLVSALAAAAANVGGVDRVIAGRSGSWEAHGLEQLLRGAVGYDEEQLFCHRTDPICISLNVAQFVDESGCLTPWDEAEAAIPWPGRTEHVDYRVIHGVGATEAELDAREDWVAALTTDYQDAYDSYATAFNQATLAAVSSMGALTNQDGTLRVPVIVQATTRPDMAGDGQCNPSEWEPDQALEWRIWSEARQVAGWPALSEVATLSSQPAFLGPTARWQERRAPERGVSKPPTHQPGTRSIR